MFIDRLTPAQLKDHYEPLTDLEAHLQLAPSALRRIVAGDRINRGAGPLEQRYC